MSSVWRRFRGRPMWVQVVGWCLVVFFGLAAIGAALGPAKKAAVKATSASTSTTLPGAAVFEAVSTGSVPPDVPMPNPSLTPGAVATTDLHLLCASGYTAKVRDVSAATKRQVFTEYGIDPARSADYEVDHLVSLEVGGSNDIRNLWPEPYAGDWGARTKDKLENRLHFDICRNAMTVDAAQHGEATNWYAQYVQLLGAPTTTVPVTTTLVAQPATTRAPVVATSPPATTPPAPQATDVYYANCDAVRAAGKAPLHRGDPGYRSGLDRDGDGVACE